MKKLFSYKKYWAERLGNAPFLPMSRVEMDTLGWDACDFIIISGDAYIDHPSFGAAVIGRVLEAQGFRVGIIAQPDLDNPQALQALGRPVLGFAISAGNMDSMINHYTSDRKKRHNDAYTPNDDFGKRPDRAVIRYTQAVKQAHKDCPVIIGGIEASLRRLAHYDYWSDTVRGSVLLDSKADVLLYGNAERAIVEIAHRLAKKQSLRDCFDIRGVAFAPSQIPDDFAIVDASNLDKAASLSKLPADFSLESLNATQNPYQDVTTNPAAICQTTARGEQAQSAEQPIVFDAFSRVKINSLPRHKTVINLPSYAAVKGHPKLYAHTNRIFHLETNPGNARHLMQQHEGRKVWITPPPIPLSTEELDGVFALPYQRVPHPAYGNAKISAFEMIKNSINIMRGCFGGCTFCSITEHEGRIIQSRSEQSILNEIEQIKKTPGFTGVVSDLGGPTANMYRLACKDKTIESNCRKLSCVFPSICSNLNTDHQPLINLYRKSREVKGVKKILIASGLRYDLAMQSPEYVKELVAHHVGGYLKIAPEHTETGPLENMMKPNIGIYDAFKKLFEETSRAVGKEQYLIPYFIAAHPGTTNEDMLNLALWLKKNNFRADQVQAFLPSPMSIATAMWYTGFSPLHGLRRPQAVTSAKGERARKLHKAFLRYHAPENQAVLREALNDMGRSDLIGHAKHCLIKPEESEASQRFKSFRRAAPANPSARAEPPANTHRHSGSKPIIGQSSNKVKAQTFRSKTGRGVAKDYR